MIFDITITEPKSEKLDIAPFVNTLEKVRKVSGVDGVSCRIDTLALEFATSNGYRYFRNNSNIEFKHKSLT